MVIMGAPMEAQGVQETAKGYHRTRTEHWRTFLILCSRLSSSNEGVVLNFS